MSELKWNWAYYPYLDPPEKQAESALKAGYIKVVNKDDADKFIADLEESHKMEVEQLLMEIVELKAENKKLKEIKDKYSSCAKKAIDSIAKCELKIRSLSRALFKTCANWAWAEHVIYVDISDGSQGYKQVQERWEKMASKCIKKAEEYK